MTDADLKRAEQRGYSKGYRAGKARKAKANLWEDQQRKENTFWQRAFLAALPSCILAQNWVFGEKSIRDVPQRTDLAKDFADRALTVAVSRGRI